MGQEGDLFPPAGEARARQFQAAFLEELRRESFEFLLTDTFPVCVCTCVAHGFLGEGTEGRRKALGSGIGPVRAGIGCGTKPRSLGSGAGARPAQTERG